MSALFAHARLCASSALPGHAEEVLAEGPGHSKEWSTVREKAGQEVAGAGSDGRVEWWWLCSIQGGLDPNNCDGYLLFIAFTNKAWQGSAWKLLI